MSIRRRFFHLLLMAGILAQCTSRNQKLDLTLLPYKIYPEINYDKPDLDSPFSSEDNEEYVVAITKDKTFAIIPVTLSNEKGICRQLVVDTLDFPSLAKNGIHSETHLDQIKTITGWSLDTISHLGRPEGLSHSGFMAADEDILSVIKADNRIVKKLGMKHRELAKPLFHVLNMMDMDLSLDRWNMARHQWENITSFNYKGNIVYIEAYDTKGGQRSIFNDSIEGAFHIKLWHEFSQAETEYLNRHYGHLNKEEMEAFKARLSFLNIGEMQPQYIMRYGFYEGHTFWRACPVAISYIFGFKSLEELDHLFNHDLFKIITTHYTP
jgi:hypothetical protein